MAIKTQDQFGEELEPTADEIWMNGQMNDTGNQVKIQGKNLPFEIKTGAGLWTMNANSQTDSDPGTGVFKYNQNSQGTSTFIYLSRYDLMGQDTEADILAMPTGSRFSVVASLSDGYGHQWQTTGAVVDGGDYMKIPVSNLVDLGNIPNNDNAKFEGATQTSATVSVSSQATGWANYEDSTYTSGSPLVVNNARVKVTNDGVTSNITSQWPSGAPDPWNTSTNKLIGESDGDSYDIRIEFTCNNGASVAYADLEFDIGGAIGVFSTSLITEAKGSGTSTDETVMVSYFTGSTFISNGCDIYLNTTPTGDNISFWDFKFFIRRTHKAV